MMIPDSKSRCEASIGDLSALLVGYWITQLFIFSHEIPFRDLLIDLSHSKRHTQLIKDELSGDSTIDASMKKEAAEIVAQQLDA